MTLFHVYHWFSNTTGWVHSSYVLGRSLKHVLLTHPQYSNKHEYLISRVK